MTNYLTQFMSQPTNIQPQGCRVQNCLLVKEAFLLQYWANRITPKPANTK